MVQSNHLAGRDEVTPMCHANIPRNRSMPCTCHQQNGHSSGVRATPTFFVNGSLCDVSYGLHSLIDAVDATLRSVDTDRGGKSGGK